jgi:hypothetical protein
MPVGRNPHATPRQAGQCVNFYMPACYGSIPPPGSGGDSAIVRFCYSRRNS